MSLHQEITQRIIDELEGGAAPWVKPWQTLLPFNAATGKRYRGVNVLLLWGARYRSPGWLTFRQAAQLGGQVRKGERASHIVYAANSMREGDDGEAKSFRFLKRYAVFNIDQVDGLPTELCASDIHQECRAAEFLKTSKAEVRHGGEEAFFLPAGDYIQLPYPERFDSIEHYYATSLHEHVHWTGHEARLAREFGKRFGDSAYAFEELVAELGAAFACAELGVTAKLRHSGYIASWVKLLGEHKQAIFSAAARATEACDFLLGQSAGDDEPLHTSS
jgi:antirestriction protein ArdC